MGQGVTGQFRKSAPKSGFGNQVPKLLRAIKFGTLALVLPLFVACSFEIGDKTEEPTSDLQDFMGVNGLFVDPTVLTPRVSVETTLLRHGAARAMGLETRIPNAKLVENLILEAEPALRPELSLRWAMLNNDEAGVSRAFEAAESNCRSLDAPEDCLNTVNAMFGILEVADSPRRSEFARLFPEVQRPECSQEEVQGTGSDLFLEALCGASAPHKALFDEAADRLKTNDSFLRESRELWALAVSSQHWRIDHKPTGKLVQRAMEESTAEGLYFDTVEAHGTVLTTWAILRLSRGERRGFDPTELEDRIKKEIEGKEPDVQFIGAAALHELGADYQSFLPTEPLTLSSPAAPYSIFIAMAARDMGLSGLVELGYREEETSGAEQVATYAVIDRILSGGDTNLTTENRQLLSEQQAQEEAPNRANLLWALGLLASGSQVDVPDVSGGCLDMPWLVADFADGLSGECDLRASLYAELLSDF